MQITPIKTPVLQPPEDNLYNAIDKCVTEIKDGDVIVVSSKVVAIHQGRCIKRSEIKDKDELIKKESDAYLPSQNEGEWNLSVAYNALLLSAGIDESNADDHYILMPEDPSAFARDVHSYLCQRFGVREIAVIIVDSHSIPFRYGTLGVSVGFFGLKPVVHFTGQQDLFGRKFQYTRINTVDALAASAVFMMGETTEQTPLCIISDAPHVEFTDQETAGELYIPPKDDIYYPLLKPFYENQDE